jgi:hypothetical protein
MKNPYQYIEEYPDRAKRIIGIDYAQFQALIKQAELLQQAQQTQHQADKIYIHAPGAGRPSRLSPAEEICLCLYYLRQFPTFEILGMQFGISKTTANTLFHDWLGILEQLLPASLFIERQNQAIEAAELAELWTEWRLIVDSFEQPRERPQGQQAQKETFSGKKKMHTFKNQAIVLPKGEDIIDIVVGELGPTSDISIFRQQQEKFASEQQFDGDKAYVGGVNMNTPHKKPKKGELSEVQKQENKAFSSDRIFVEHVIRLIKIFRVAQARFRLHPDSYNQIILVVCGLVRLRIGAFKLAI